MRKLFLSIIALMFSIGLWAQETTQTVSYLYPVYNTTDDPTSGIKEWKTGSVEATVVESSLDDVVVWGTTGQTTWYVVKGENVTLSQGAECNGDVHLILADGAKLSATGYVVVTEDDKNNKPAISVSESFTVYGQTNQSGKLLAYGTPGHAGICGNSPSIIITINGGVIDANGFGGSAGIGGEKDSQGCDIIINGGVVMASSERGGAGIGAGKDGGVCNIVINGGTVTGKCTNVPNVFDHGVGIGDGYGASGSNITINGGTITAEGEDQSTAIGGIREGEHYQHVVVVKVATSLLVKADNSNPPTTLIENNGGNLAESLIGKRYAVVFDLSPIIAAAIKEIDLAIEGVTDENILAIANTAKTNIGNATTEEAINSIKTLALAKINALYQILIARQGIQNAEINSMINDAVNIISNATDTERITDAMLDAMTVIGLFQNGKAEGIEQGRAEALGEMGEPCEDCPSVEVTGQNDNMIKLYNPKNVTFKKME